MYENIGGKIKALAKGTFILESIVAIIVGIILTADSEEPIFLVICVFGPLVAWVSSWLLYAFGEMVEDIHDMRGRIAPSSEQDVAEEAERRAKEQAAIEKAKQDAERTAAAEKAAEELKKAQENTDREVLKKNFNSIPPMEKPADFKFDENWGIQRLSVKQLTERYMAKDEWSESYRYACYLELKKRIS